MSRLWNYFFGKPEPPPPELYDTPWREMNWGNRDTDLQYVNNYKPQAEGQQLRILLHGQVGAGKSSFINSVKSVLQQRVRPHAHVKTSSHGCTTKQYTTYRIPKGNSGTFYPFVLNDMMGLKEISNRKARQIHVKDVKQALKGHIRDGYAFNPESKLSKDDHHYNSTPSNNDKVHVVVFVIDASTVSLMSTETKEVIEDIRDEAAELGIPQMVIFTKIDMACPNIGRDITNIYKSISLHQKMKQFSEDTGIPLNLIFPVKNYHSETELRTDVDALILSILRRIIQTGDDFLNIA